MVAQSLKTLISSTLPKPFRDRLRQLKTQLNVKLLRLAKKDIDYFYDEGFATSPFRNKSWTPYFCDLILSRFKPQSIVDFGCGTGDILKPFEAKGLDVLGLDGSQANQRHCQLSPENFSLRDLRDKIQLDQKYSLCICVEVAEHIEEKYSNTLIANLAAASDRIIFTAALPGQDEGIDHCNLKPHQWWIDRFEAIGFRLDREASEWLQGELSKNPAVQPWYIENLHIFSNPSSQTHHHA